MVSFCNPVFLTMLTFALVVGTLKPEKMITSTIPLDNLVEGGIKALITDKESHVKILVKVGG